MRVIEYREHKIVLEHGYSQDTHKWEYTACVFFPYGDTESSVSGFNNEETAIQQAETRIRNYIDMDRLVLLTKIKEIENAAADNR